jgi:predicted 2-oxoglutarate/Fe(II)-dependent dioxygenase YbiX
MAHYYEESRDVFSIPLYDAKSCKEIVRYIKQLEGWSSAQVRNEVGPAEFVTSVRPDARIAKILNSVHTGELYDEFDEKINKIVKPLIKKIFDVSLDEHGGTQFLRYPPGGHYVPHEDAGSDMQYRYFTVVCYLNDDFEGGHTWFPSLNYSMVPQAGKALLFPSRFYHCAQPVIRGEKFVIVSWVNGPVPLKWI